MEKRDFNLAAKIFLGISVLDIILNIVKAYTKYRVAFFGGETLIFEMIINFMILIAIAFTFVKKRWALIALIVLYVIRMFALVSYRSDISISYQLGGNFAYLIRDFGFFAIAMCFKKDGVSGWKAMLLSEEKLLAATTMDDNSVPPPIVTQLEETKSHDEDVCEDATAAKIDSNNRDNDCDKNKQDRLVGRDFWKKFLIWIVSLVPLALIVTFVIIILSDTYPKHIESFRDKVLYYCDIPNEKLAQEYWEKYSKANDSDLLDLSIEYLKVVQLANTKNLDILNGAMGGFDRIAENVDSNSDDYYRNVISIARKIIAVDKANISAYEYLVRAYYNLESYADAYKAAEDLLLLDPLNPIGISAMCRKSEKANTWGVLLKWAEKGYNHISKNDANYIEILYFYAKALYESGDKIQAKQIYNEAEAIDFNNYLHDKFIGVGGVPCVVNSVSVANQTYDGVVITRAGANFYDDNTRYFCPTLSIKPYRSGVFTFDVKLYENGSLSTGSDSPSGYSYSRKVRLDKNKSQMSIDLGGWGSDKPGNWEAGAYRFEIWWDGKKIASKSFNVYSEFTYRLFGRNAFE